MQTEEKTIRFTPTRRDLLAFNIRTIAQNRIVIGMVGVGFLFIVISDSMYKPNPPVPFTVRFIAALLSGLIVALVGAVVGLVSVLLIIWTGKFKNVLTEQTATITDAGLAGTSATGEGVTKWTGIHKVDSTRRLLIIYTNETTARIIPKRCFPNPETAAAFEQEIRSRMKSG